MPRPATATFRDAQEQVLRRYGVDARSRFLDVPAVGGRAHVLEAGAGPPVLLVAGLDDPAAMWAPLMAHLGGFRLLAVERPGIGLTGAAEHRTATLRRLATDFLAQTLDALGLERAPILGNSMGSLWATWLALDRPERVAALVHVGCPALALGTSAPRPLRLLSVPPVGRLLRRIAPPSERQLEAFERVVGEDLSGAPELRALLLAAQRLPNATDTLLGLLHAVLRLRGARPEVALTAEQLERVRPPVLLVWGAHDGFGGPDVAARVAHHLPDATLHILPDAGHLPWIAYPDEVAALATPFLRAHAEA